MSNIELTRQEQRIVDAYTQYQTDKILRKFKAIRTWFENEFRYEMSRIAKQEGCKFGNPGDGIIPKPKHYEHLFQKIMPCGIGYSLGWVISSLGIPYDASTWVKCPHKPMSALVMRKAMEQCEELNLFIRSIVTGAYMYSYLYGSNEMHLDEEMAKLLGIDVDCRVAAIGHFRKLKGRAPYFYMTP